MDSKESRTIAVPVLTLEWWRQLAHDNPQDLPPCIEQYLQRDCDIKSALLDAWKNTEALAFAYMNTLPGGDERAEAMESYLRIWRVFGQAAPAEPMANAMPPHLSQMLEELEKLSLRLKELNAFIEGEDFKMLKDKDQHLLKCQATYMADYQDVLVTRVAAAS